MNLLFLVEGRKTEPRIYQQWIEFTFPQLKLVKEIQKITTHCYCIVSGKGYPSIFTPSKYMKSRSPLELCLIELNKPSEIDHFFICIDSEEDDYQTRFQEVEIILEETKTQVDISSSLNTQIHIIVQHCCIETWFLGHIKMLRKNPHSETLLKFKRFYEVSLNDPELMDCCPSGYLYSTKAHFHEAYLKEMLRERGLKYSKIHPGVTAEKHYLDALRQRCKTTGHLPSLKRLLDILDAI